MTISSYSHCLPSGGELYFEPLGFIGSMQKKNKNSGPSASHEKNVGVTAGCTVTLRPVPVARLELNARSVGKKPLGFGLNCISCCLCVFLMWRGVHSNLISCVESQLVRDDFFFLKKESYSLPTYKGLKG